MESGSPIVPTQYYVLKSSDEESPDLNTLNHQMISRDKEERQLDDEIAGCSKEVEVKEKKVKLRRDAINAIAQVATGSNDVQSLFDEAHQLDAETLQLKKERENTGAAKGRESVSTDNNYNQSSDCCRRHLTSKRPIKKVSKEARKRNARRARSTKLRPSRLKVVFELLNKHEKDIEKLKLKEEFKMINAYTSTPMETLDEEPEPTFQAVPPQCF